VLPNINAREIKPLTTDKCTLDLIAAESRAIVSEREDLGLVLPAPDVAKRLIRSTVVQAETSGAEKEVKGRGGKVLLRYSKSRGGFTFKVPAKSNGSDAEVLEAIGALLENG